MVRDTKKLFFIIFFVMSFVFSYIIFLVYDRTKNILTTSFLIAFFVFLGFLIKNILDKIEGPNFSGKTALRYTMLCKSCGWEWMSNTTEKQPSKCPNCNEKDKLEVLGWRKVRIPDKKINKDLRAFFKQKLSGKD